MLNIFSSRKNKTLSKKKQTHDPIQHYFLSKASLFMITAASLASLPLVSKATDINNLRGQRYCEVIFWHGLSGFVYNTLNLNQCPNHLWSKLTPTIVKKVSNSHFVYLNGPRNYIVDEVRNMNINEAKIKSFGHIPMHQTATMHIKVKDIFLGAAPYREHQVKRDLVWVYHAGKPVYELVNAQGQVYVMQSYTSEVKAQNQATLPNLQQKLNLPKGWTFRTGTLKENKVLAAQHHHAIILLDNYKNVYQRVSKDLL